MTTNIRSRVTKIEQKTRQSDLVLIIVQDNETNAEALCRCYPNDAPEKVLYLMPEDEYL